MVQNVHGTYISEKINKIRWRPDAFSYSYAFVTGSWDNDSQNSIKLWRFEEGDDMDIFPFTIQSFPFQGDITEIKFINPDFCVASSSIGSLSYLKFTTVHKGDTQITQENRWEKIHKFKNNDNSSCTGFASYNNDIASVGEDGCINLLNVEHKNVIRSLNEADSSCLNCVTFLKHSEILTGNSRGQMKIWDLRSEDVKPCSTFMLSPDQVASTCLTYHPTQRHIVIAGDEEGSLTVWDLRQNTFPVNLLSAHSESVAEIQFHPDHPDQMFSCSFSGELWHWITNKSSFHGGKLLDVSEVEINPWSSTDQAKNKFEVFMLMPKLHKPINSIDLNYNRVLCGCDNEALYLIDNINIYN
ncbi:hypothetical protein PPYR_10491 [Photinus pyralis]|uniref:Uncharacterized protein n=1 Tax=Photinus pyralis TaxID=7054 RepID=A0A1Y1NBI4_PHOPY|nr:nucleoporin Nup43 [Photinus pyralis]KAB0796430.1 hypothetical protein PPYR_10491 [Photinus pyralis]